jgi:hypothetical protein
VKFRSYGSVTARLPCRRPGNCSAPAMLGCLRGPSARPRLTAPVAASFTAAAALVSSQVQQGGGAGAVAQAGQCLSPRGLPAAGLQHAPPQGRAQGARWRALCKKRARPGFLPPAGVLGCHKRASSHGSGRRPGWAASRLGSALPYAKRGAAKLLARLARRCARCGSGAACWRWARWRWWRASSAIRCVAGPRGGPSGRQPRWMPACQLAELLADALAPAAGVRGTGGWGGTRAAATASRLCAAARRRRR